MLLSEHRRIVLALLLGTGVALAGPKRQKVDFDSERIEGEIERPAGTYVLERPAAKFRCDITKLTLEEYNACFTRHVVDLCGMQMIARDRFELERVGYVTMQGARARTVGSAFPYVLKLLDGQLWIAKASEYDEYVEGKLWLRNQSPKIDRIDWFHPAKGGFLVGEQKSRRVWELTRGASRRGHRRSRRWS
jgi:hypothetical protein